MLVDSVMRTISLKVRTYPPESLEITKVLIRDEKDDRRMDQHCS